TNNSPSGGPGTDGSPEPADAPEGRAMRRGMWICLSPGLALCAALLVRAGDESPASGAAGVPVKKAPTARKVRLPRLFSGTFVGDAAAPSRAAVLYRGTDGDAVRHWAFHAPVRPALPPVHNVAWVRNAIDYFLLARLDKEGLSPAREADRVTLIRRLSL